MFQHEQIFTPTISYLRQMKKLFRKILAKKKQIGIILLLFFFIIQFIRPERNSVIANNGNDISHFTSVSPEVKTILETSCYDCHSDHTNYPWYTNIQPVGWWLNDHVNEGKEEVNFSQFKKYRIKRQIRKFEEIADQLKEDEMPLNTYLWIHGNAKLSDVQKKELSDWANSNYDSLAKRYPDSIPKSQK